MNVMLVVAHLPPHLCPGVRTSALVPDHLRCGAQSPAFTCRSSFCPFLVEASTPCLASGGCCSIAMVFPIVLNSPPSVSSMPSFAFFNPSSMVVKVSCTLEFSASIDAVHQEMSSGKLLLLLDSLSFRLEAKEMINRSRLAEAKGAGMTTRFRISGIHRKRNCTIGLGECKQLDIMVNESTSPVIMHASYYLSTIFSCLLT